MIPKMICFDIDGTLFTEKMENEGQYVKGIIPTNKLKELENSGHIIAIVSPSPFYPDNFMVFCRNGSNDYRWENINDAMRCNNIKSKYDVCYVDDLDGNRKQIREWGVMSFSPEEFMKLTVQQEDNEK